MCNLHNSLKEGGGSSRNTPRILLLCGGQSDEHEVSLSSARAMLAALGDRLPVTSLVVSRRGALLSPEGSRRALLAGASDQEDANGTLAQLSPEAFDVVFPLFHGPFGEDGSVQGMLKLMGLPHVGSGVLASAVGMDKIAMKQLFSAHGFPQVAFRGVRRHQWREEPRNVLETLEALALPVFVKPANLGSSIGIHRVDRPEELRAALDDAFAFDRRVIVEAGLTGARELEVGVLGNDAPMASPVGEILHRSSYYDYRTKYTQGLAELQIPAQVPDEAAGACRRLALEAFRAIDGAGLARVDFFFHEPSGRILLNEINTMPGFTPTSMYPRLWEAAGIPYRELVERLARLALETR